MVCKALSEAKRLSSLPRSQDTADISGDVAECRQIPKPVFGAGKRTLAETRPNNSQHHEIVRGRTEIRANEGICRNERVALVFRFLFA